MDILYLFHRYRDDVYRLAVNYTRSATEAEDVCQTVFLKYMTGNMTFDSIEHEKAWIIRTAINACKDHVKGAWFKRTVALEDASAIAAPTVPDTWLLDAMKGLPEKYRISLYLYYYEDYSAREIAKVMGVSESAVGQYLTRGRRKLRTILTEEERRIAL